MPVESNAPAGPLAGIKVVDFSSFIAGCYAAQLMGDFGAEVIKVEPLQGDGARTWGPFLAGEGRFFQGWNRNKKGIALDLRTKDGLAIAHDLVREADVVVENYRVGVAKRLKIDYDTLREINPRLIYLSVSAFGSRGPFATRPAYDPVLQAMSGAARGHLRFSGKIHVCSVAVADYGAAMLGMNGVVMALYHRERSGEGQHVETSLLQAVMSVQSQMLVKALDIEEEPPLGIFPYTFFDTQDDMIFIAAATDKFWRLLCDILEAPELGDNPRYATNAQRVTHTDEITAALHEYLRHKTTAEWETIFLAADLPCGSPTTYMEFFETEQVAAMDMNPLVNHTAIGPMRLAGVPIHLEKTPGRIQSAPPLLGEHTDEILRALGKSAEEITSFRDKGVVR